MLYSRNVLGILLAAVILVFAVPAAFAQETNAVGIAVLDLQANGIAESEAVALTEMLRAGISKTIKEQSAKITENYNFIERSQMDKIFDEFEIQGTGCTDISCAIEFGKMLNVDKIVLGSVSLVGSTYMVIVRTVDVKTGKALTSVDRKQRGIIDNVIDLMPIVAHELLTGERLAAPEITLPQSTPDPAAIAESGGAYLTVTGTPKKVQVYLGSTLIGTTPLDYRKINPGRYRLKLSADGYEDYENEIVVAPDESEKISYHLQKLANLSVSGFPEGAAVFIDGKKIGTTPLDNKTMPQGSYSLIVKYEGYGEYGEHISLSAGAHKKVSYTLNPMESISVNGFPSGAAVSIDGVHAGNAPLANHVIPAGNYKIVIQSPGYEKYAVNVFIGRGKPLDISYHLSPKSKNGVLTRSLIFPGSGQRYAEYRGKGMFISALQIITLGAVAATSVSALGSWDDYDKAEETYRKARSDADFGTLYDDLESKYNSASDAGNLQNAAIAAACAVYIYNVLDALMTEPRIELSSRYDTIQITPVVSRHNTGLAASVRF